MFICLNQPWTAYRKANTTFTLPAVTGLVLCTRYSLYNETHFLVVFCLFVCLLLNQIHQPWTLYMNTQTGIQQNLRKLLGGPLSNWTFIFTTHLPNIVRIHLQLFMLCCSHKHTVGPHSTVVVYSARDREVAGSNPHAVLPVLCPWERPFTRLSSLYSSEKWVVPRIGR